MNGAVHSERSLNEILSELKEELQEFARTRIELFRRELDEKTRTLKAALPLIIMGLIFLSTGFFLLSFALVSLIAAWFGSTTYRWFFGFLIVAVLWCVVGAIVALIAKQRITEKGVLPNKTIEVLKADKVWVQQEARKVQQEARNAL